VGIMLAIVRCSRKTAMKRRQGFILLVLLLATPVTVSAANVVTDWDEKAVCTAQTGTAPPRPTGFRTMALLHLVY
jgi:hypothetical protein